MQKILIIKTGAAGDIVRTTVLLSILKGDITWVIEGRYRSILPEDHPSLSHIVSLPDAAVFLKDASFDLVLSLEEDRRCAELAMSVKTLKLTGILIQSGKLTYTADAASWFDMSLLSVFGQPYANQAKMANKMAFQYHLLQMIGCTFCNEPYAIYRNHRLKVTGNLVGIEKRAGNRWPNKRWSGYSDLHLLLEKSGYAVKILEEKNNIREYLDEIASCNYIISGDTLAMHVAIAYEKPALAIFNCTSPDEIHAYGKLVKIISPFLSQVYYKTTPDADAVSAISVETVFKEACVHFKQ